MRGEYDPNTYIRYVDSKTGRVTIADTEDDVDGISVETAGQGSPESLLPPVTEDDLDIRVGEMRDRVNDDFQITMTSEWRDVVNPDSGLDILPTELEYYATQLDQLDQQASDTVKDWESEVEVIITGDITNDQTVDEPRQPGRSLPDFGDDPHQLKLKSYLAESNLRRNQQALPAAEARLKQAEASASSSQSEEVLQALEEARRNHAIITSNIMSSEGRLRRLSQQIAEREKADDFSVTVDGVNTGSDKGEQDQADISMEQPVEQEQKQLDVEVTPSASTAENNVTNTVDTSGVEQLAEPVAQKPKLEPVTEKPSEARPPSNIEERADTVESLQLQKSIAERSADTYQHASSALWGVSNEYGHTQSVILNAFVKPHEIEQYGRSLHYLGEKMKERAEILGRNNPDDLQVLDQEITAVQAKVAEWGDYYERVARGLSEGTDWREQNAATTIFSAVRAVREALGDSKI